MKKLSLTLLLATTSMLSCASDLKEMLAYNNFYIGSDIGLSDFIVKQSTLYNAPELHQLGSLGIVGGGLIGFDYHVTDRINIGLEGFGNANGLNTGISHDTQGTDYSINARYNAGIRVLPAYAFTPELEGHVLLGYSSINVQVQDNGTYGYTDQSFNKSGFQSGLGWTSSMTQHLLLRLDGLYTIYQGQSTLGQGLSGATSPIQLYKNNLSTFEGDVSLIYKF